MTSNKRWVAIALITAMMFALVPLAQAEEGQGQSAQRNLAAGLSYEWSEEPDAKYPDDNHKLTDGQYGQLDMSDPAWVGHVNKKTREIVFDLGEKKSISSIKARFLQDWPTGSSLVPLTVSMYASDDKVNWGTLSHQSTKLLWGDGPPREEVFDWVGSRDGIKSGNSGAEMAYARYVKVTFSMHTRAWSLIDEVEIWGADGKVGGAEQVAAEQPALLEPGEATAGIRNLGLLYNGQYANGKGDWSKERIIPNISYVDRTGEPVDWLFDGVLYLGLTSPAGNGYNGGANLEDWKWYLDKTFAETGDMQQLNEAAMEVGAKLNQPDHKVKVVLMIPDPGEYLNDFGDVDGDGISESFNASQIGEEAAFANREKAVQWWLNETKQRWAAESYTNLELAGMYWLEEQISTSATGPDLLRSASKKVHDSSLKLFWIPHFLAYKSHMWKEVGIDAVAFQPNYFFEELGMERLEDASNIAKRYGMGLELEFDDRMVNDAVFRERFVDYLNSGVETGLMKSGFKAYYQGNNAVTDTAVSTDPATRILYDWLYQFVNGTYQVNNAAPPEAVVQMNGQLLQSGAVVPFTESVQFGWEVKNDDGSGLTKVSAAFDGKTYTQGTVIDLAGKPGKHELTVTVAAGKSQKTSYVIEAATSISDMKVLVKRFDEDKQFKNEDAARSLNNYLEMAARFKGSDEAKAASYLKGFNAKLELFKKDQLIADGAYNTLKEGIYSLIGNLALNKAVSASSVESANLNYAAEKAVDGFPATRWSSETINDVSFQIDLGEVRELDTVRFDWEYARAKTYRLTVSDDKQNWTNVSKENDGIITAKEGRETVHFDPIKARYIKFQGIERATFYGYSLYAFEVYSITGAESGPALDGMKAVVDAATKKVTIDGLAMNGDLAKVSLRVVDPQGKDHFEARTTSTKDGSFQFAFTLTGEKEGVYEAYVTTDGMGKPEKMTFEYKRASTGVGGGNSVVTVPDLFQIQSDGSVKAEISSKLDSSGTTAISAVSEQDLLKAIAKAKADQNGMKKVSMSVKKNGEAVKYALDLPAALLSEYPKLLLEVSLPKATILLSGQMLPKSADLGKMLRLIIGERDGKLLKQDGRTLLGPAIDLSAEMDGKAYSWMNEKAPITVTVPYLRSDNETATKIGMLSINDQGAASAIANAEYSHSAQQIKFQTDRTGTYAAYAEQPSSPFADLVKYGWAREAVEQLAALGIVKGTSATTFSPAAQVSRADFVLMLVRALDLKGEAAEAWADVKPQDYYYEAAATAKQFGIVTGTDGERFAPKAKITRQDMIVMAARALKAAQGKEIKGDLATLDRFKDADKVSGYAAYSMAGLIEQGLIQGDGGMIKPLNPSTRAETAMFLHRLMRLWQSNEA
ncbi:DUF4855 domain-containing protein [Paenibacillus sp. FJAT-27812]|uniref:DUF4855 domain-containing protein n=1 Tax=Paenibacillus sp. FJAT-27812 TaxID=1684143 RepID=UPI0007C7E6DC|nr:DUF4855 domain-containing protein [Paenibacillus sp. FJAT-27812]